MNSNNKIDILESSNIIFFFKVIDQISYDEW